MLPGPHPYHYRKRYTADPAVAALGYAAWRELPRPRLPEASMPKSRIGQAMLVAAAGYYGRRRQFQPSERLRKGDPSPVAERKGDSDHPSKTGRPVRRRCCGMQNDAVSASNTLQCRCKGCLTQKAALSMWL